MIKALTILSAFVISGSAMAASVNCTISSEIDGKAVAPHQLSLAVDSNPNNCEKSMIYTIPGTTLDITVHGHGDCNPAPEFCPDVGPTVGGIEAHDKKSGNYSKTYGACLRSFEEMYLQTIVPGTPRVNVVVACSLAK